MKNVFKHKYTPPKPTLLPVEAQAFLFQDERNSPLKDIHFDSLATLSRLNVRINCELAVGEPIPVFSHPYAWQWAIVLGRLRGLQSLKLHFSLQSFYHVFITAFGPRWARISSDLAAPGVLPLLTELSVVFEARTFKHLKNMELQRFWDVFGYFKSTAAQALRGQGRTIAFSFEVVTSIGPVLQERFHY